MAPAAQDLASARCVLGTPPRRAPQGPSIHRRRCCCAAAPVADTVARRAATPASHRRNRRLLPDGCSLQQRQAVRCACPQQPRRPANSVSAIRRRCRQPTVSFLKGAEVAGRRLAFTAYRSSSLPESRAAGSTWDGVCDEYWEPRLPTSRGIGAIAWAWPSSSWPSGCPASLSMLDSPHLTHRWSSRHRESARKTAR